jgi:hypothetical protein
MIDSHKEDSLMETYWLRSLGLTAVAMSTLLSGPAIAEQVQISAFAPWEAEGKVYSVGPAEKQFIGVFEGIVYVEKREGEFDTAILVCPTTQELNTESNKTTASGRCHIVATRGNVFGRFSCTGDPGYCDGRFEITGGTDEFEGISGGGDMRIRITLSATMRDAVSGELVAEAKGLAIWPNLTYSLPSGR